MKGWLRRLTLLAMQSAFGGEHAFAQQHARTLHRAFLDEIVLLHNENFAYVIRMTQEHEVV